MRIAVCEDNKDTCTALAARVRGLMPDADIVLFMNAEELIASNPVPDIVLLDIVLDGMSGLDAAHALRKNGADCAIIFVSGRDEYVFDAFDVDAVSYLRKPVDAGKLEEVLRRAQNQLDRTRSERWDRQIIIMSGGRRVRVRIDTIRFAEVYNRTVVLHTTDGQISYYGRLSALEDKCGPDFCRTHRAYLVNMRFVDSYCSSHAMVGSDPVPISKKRHPSFVAQFTDYVRGLSPA